MVAGVAPLGPAWRDRAASGGVAATPDELADAYETHWRLLWSVASGILGGQDGVEDVLQESVIVALRRLDDFTLGTSWAAWLARIVQLTALNHGRKRQRRRGDASVPPDDIVDERGAGDGGPPIGAAGGDRAGRGSVDGHGRLRPDQAAFDDRVVAALDQLGAVPRACLLLRVVAELPYREIARALDLPEGTAMSHVHRARRAVRDQLRRGDGEEAPGR